VRALAAAVTLGLLSGCAGILHAPAEGRPESQTEEAALLSGMNPDLLGPKVRHVHVEVDWVEGWVPGERALEAMKEELRRWIPAQAEVQVHVDEPIALERWTRAEDTFAHAAGLVREQAAAPPPEEETTDLHVVYVPSLRPFGEAGALGLTVRFPEDSRTDVTRATVLLSTERIRKVAVLWIGPRKVEHAVLVHEVGHVLGLVADGAHQHRGDPTHCRNSACLMVSSANRGALLAGAPRAIFLGRLPTAYCAACRHDLEAARSLYASQTPEAWSSLQTQRAIEDRRTQVAFLMESGEAEAAVVELQSWESDREVGLRWLAQTLRGLGRAEEAFAAGRELASLDPQGRTVETRVDPLLDMGRWTEALEEVDRAKAAGYHDVRLEMRALVGAGRAEEADERLRVFASKADPRAVSWVHKERLWLWRAAGQPKRGVQLYQSLSSREVKRDPDLALEAGCLLLDAGRTEEAQQLLRPLAKRSKARHRGEVAAIVRARAHLGDGEGALRGMEKTKSWFYPGEFDLLRGEVLAILGRESEAVAALQEARRAGAGPRIPCLDPNLVTLRHSPQFQALYPCAASGR